MVKHEFTFPSADSKTNIHAVSWLPDGTPVAVLQIAHGISEYVLRYEPFAQYLTEQGFAVVEMTISVTACPLRRVRPGSISARRAVGTMWWTIWNSSAN